jgi:hypothetical protein
VTVTPELIEWANAERERMWTDPQPESAEDVQRRCSAVGIAPEALEDLVKRFRREESETALVGGPLPSATAAMLSRFMLGLFAGRREVADLVGKGSGS